MVSDNPIERFGVVVIQEYYAALARADRDGMADFGEIMRLIEKHWPDEMDAARAHEIGF